MDLTVQNVYGLLLRSKLLSLEDARAMFARWNEENKDQANNVARFAGWMVARGYLTEYQAGLLARGHAEGLVLGEYKILERLGKGRMAGVYKAQHRLGQLVAIKVLPPSRARDATLLARFQREARLAIRLRHPNIVRTFQTGCDDGLHYLVMELLEGETLQDVLERRKQFPPEEAVRLVYQALLGLQHIHEQGLVHRDLKPANLMLVPAPTADSTHHCTVKILDIGLGRVLLDESEEPDGGLTAEGVLLGTPDYMAPEQARDPRSSDIRADIYSLGCVLYHLLAGHPPFPDTNIISQMIRHASEAPRPLAEINPKVVDGLQQIVNWMMAKEPDKRYATPGRAASALEVYLAADSRPASSPDIDPQMQPYLNWLQTEESKAPAASEVAAPPALALPAVGTADKPRSKSRDAKADKHDKSKKRSSESRKDRSEKKPRVPPPPPLRTEPAAVPPPTPPLVEVELVTLPDHSGEPPLWPPGEFTRRDLVLFLLGVFSGVLAIFAGQGLASLFRGSRPRPSEPDDQ
jgi:serine/threonine protein kinase